MDRLLSGQRCREMKIFSGHGRPFRSWEDRPASSKKAFRWRHASASNGAPRRKPDLFVDGITAEGMRVTPVGSERTLPMSRPNASKNVGAHDGNSFSKIGILESNSCSFRMSKRGAI